MKFKLRKSLVLVACMGVFVSGNTLADGIRDAINAAVSRSPEVTQSRAENREAIARREGAETEYYPDTRFRRAYGVSRSTNAGSRGTRTNPRGETSLTVNQLLYDFGNTKHRIEAKKQEEAASLDRVSEARRKITMDVIAAYGNVLKFQEQQDVYKRSLSYHQELNGRLRKAVEVGAVRSPDLALGEARAALLRSELATVTGQLAKARQSLAQLTGNAMTNASGWGLRPKGAPDANTAVLSALSQRPELNAIRHETVAASEELQARQAMRWPVLTLELGYSDREDYDGQKNGFRDERDFSAQVVVTHNLLTNGVFFSQIAEAAARRDAAQASLQVAEESVVRDTQDRWHDVQTLQEREAQLLLYTESARRLRDGMEGQFKAGIRGLIDILNGDNEMRNSELTLAATRQDLMVAHLQLQTALGQIQW